MVTVALFVIGLALGSFCNALVWRVHEQAAEKSKKRPSTKRLESLSIGQGRSMCPHCGHKLAAKDLIPVISWMLLKGRCRYCAKPISIQYPLVELLMGVLFVVSYHFWPIDHLSGQAWLFGLWMMLLVGLVSLLVYDLRWMLLPNRIMYPLSIIAGLMALVTIVASDYPLRTIQDVFLAVMVGGGLFYVLFQVSKGKWIGGGDVKLGAVLGLVMATPGRSFLMIFLAATLGSLASLPLLASNRLNKTSTIPFGPFLISAAIIVQLFGHSILHWYQRSFFPYAP